MPNRYRYPSFWDAENKPTDPIREIAARYVDPHTGDMPRQIVAVPSSAQLVVASVGSKTTNSTTAVKVKEIAITYPGVYKLSFALRTNYNNNNTATAYAQVYKNGAVIGTVQDSSALTFDTRQEDIGPWDRDDLCQLYLWHSTTLGTAEIMQFAIWGRLDARPGDVPAGTINLA